MNYSAAISQISVMAADRVDGCCLFSAPNDDNISANLAISNHTCNVEFQHNDFTRILVTPGKVVASSSSGITDSGYADTRLAVGIWKSHPPFKTQHLVAGIQHLLRGTSIPASIAQKFLSLNWALDFANLKEYSCTKAVYSTYQLPNLTVRSFAGKVTLSDLKLSPTILEYQVELTGQCDQCSFSFDNDYELILGDSDAFAGLTSISLNAKVQIDRTTNNFQCEIESCFVQSGIGRLDIQSDSPDDLLKVLLSNRVTFELSNSLSINSQNQTGVCKISASRAEARKNFLPLGELRLSSVAVTAISDLWIETHITTDSSGSTRYSGTFDAPQAMTVISDAHLPGLRLQGYQISHASYRGSFNGAFRNVQYYLPESKAEQVRLSVAHQSDVPNATVLLKGETSFGNGRSKATIELASISSDENVQFDFEGFRVFDSDASLDVQNVTSDGGTLKSGDLIVTCRPPNQQSWFSVSLPTAGISANGDWFRMTRFSGNQRGKFLKLQSQIIEGGGDTVTEFVIRNISIQQAFLEIDVDGRPLNLQLQPSTSGRDAMTSKLLSCHSVRSSYRDISLDWCVDGKATSNGSHEVDFGAFKLSLDVEQLKLNGSNTVENSASAAADIYGDLKLITEGSDVSLDRVLIVTDILNPCLRSAAKSHSIYEFKIGLGEFRKRVNAGRWEKEEKLVDLSDVLDFLKATPLAPYIIAIDQGLDWISDTFNVDVDAKVNYLYGGEYWMTYQSPPPPPDTKDSVSGRLEFNARGNLNRLGLKLLYYHPFKRKWLGVPGAEVSETFAPAVGFGSFDAHIDYEFSLDQKKFIDISARHSGVGTGNIYGQFGDLILDQYLADHFTNATNNVPDGIQLPGFKSIFHHRDRISFEGSLRADKIAE